MQQSCNNKLINNLEYKKQDNINYKDLNIFITSLENLDSSKNNFKKIISNEYLY